MFCDLDWPLNASRGFVSISWASCFINKAETRKTYPQEATNTAGSLFAVKTSLCACRSNANLCLCEWKICPQRATTSRYNLDLWPLNGVTCYTRVVGFFSAKFQPTAHFPSLLRVSQSVSQTDRQTDRETLHNVPTLWRWRHDCH